MSNKSCGFRTSSIFYVLLLFLVRQTVFEQKLRKTGEKNIFPSNSECLNPFRTLFIYDGEQKNGNFYFRGLFLKHLRGGIYRNIRRIKDLFSYFQS